MRKILFISSLLSLIILSGCKKNNPPTEDNISVEFDKTELTLEKGESYELSVKVIPTSENLQVIWNTTDDNIVSVENGIITANNPGKASITATVNTITDTCNVTVTAKKPESIELDKESIDMIIGDRATLKASVHPEDAEYDAIVWTSSNNDIVTVDNGGNITALANGNAIIIASAGELKDSCKITVSSPQPAIGDFFYTDGTFSPVLDKSKTVCGIVFWIGDPSNDDSSLKREFPETSTGLVVGLYESTSFWQGTLETYDASVAEWITNNTDDYFTIATDESGNDPDYMNKTVGYNNTKGIELFNTENPDNPVNAIDFILKFRNENTAPENTSGWYLPSIKELFLMSTSDFDGNIWSSNEYRHDVLDKINESLSKIEGSKIISGQYWSNNEYSGDYWMAFYMNFDDTTVGSSEKCYFEYKLRPILAF